MTSYQWLNELISYLFLILDSHVWQLIISVIILHLCSSTMQYLNIHNHVKKKKKFFFTMICKAIRNNHANIYIMHQTGTPLLGRSYL